MLKFEYAGMLDLLIKKKKIILLSLKLALIYMIV